MTLPMARYSMLQDLINQEVRKREPKEQRHWYISRLGSCLSGQYYERLGIPPDMPFDDRTMRVFSVGNVFEDWIVKLIQGSHSQEIQRVDTQIAVESEELDISGYVDLEVNGIPYELKTVHSGAFWHMVDGYKMVRNEQGKKERVWVEGNGAYPHHEIQLWTYLLLLNRSVGKLVYISKDDLTIQEYEVKLNNELLRNQVIGKGGILDQLNEAWRTKTPPQPNLDKDSWQYKRCNWHQTCLAGVENEDNLSLLSSASN